MAVGVVKPQLKFDTFYVRDANGWHHKGCIASCDPGRHAAILPMGIPPGDAQKQRTIRSTCEGQRGNARAAAEVVRNYSRQPPLLEKKVLSQSNHV